MSSGSPPPGGVTAGDNDLDGVTPHVGAAAEVARTLPSPTTRPARGKSLAGPTTASKLAARPHAGCSITRPVEAGTRAAIWER